MAAERRRGERVTFERGIRAQLVAIDGSWQRDCVMEDISETGAKLSIEGPIDGLDLKEFFLLMSSSGLTYRRCEMAWSNGEQVGATFIRFEDKKKKARRAAQAADT